VEPSSNGGSRVATVAILGALILGSAVISAAPAAASSGIAVYVGYADSLRANAISFPTPWQGSPNTIFEGCVPAASCVFDSGAVQVFNGSSSAVHVDAIVVTVGTCVFNRWPSASLPSGDGLIVTQLQSGATDGCTENSPASLMDTSDVGPNGISYTGICTPDHLIPTVDVTIDGTSTRYFDSGQVLNTGGFDMGVCVGNESTQWTVIGNPPCHNSALTLTPPSQAHPVFSTATVTATFNACGQPLANAAVDFSVAAGPNAGRTGSGATNGQGQASFSYSSTQVGTDTVTASISNPAGVIDSNPVTVIWTAGFAQGGVFVIGDLENVEGGAAYWWGAQWWKQDPLSGGLAPASFKGFENSNPAPWCGDTWTTRPGNSSRPPKSVSPYMAVIVASHVTKSGPTISGDVVGIVVVKTDPGYGPNPGHRGTGTIVATLCGKTASAGALPSRPLPHGTGQELTRTALAGTLVAPARTTVLMPPSPANGRRSELPHHKPRGKSQTI
jgi:hypothetical protein